MNDWDSCGLGYHDHSHSSDCSPVHRNGAASSHPPPPSARVSASHQTAPTYGSNSSGDALMSHGLEVAAGRNKARGVIEGFQASGIIEHNQNASACPPPPPPLPISLPIPPPPPAPISLPIPPPPPQQVSVHSFAHATQQPFAHQMPQATHMPIAQDPNQYHTAHIPPQHHRPPMYITPHKTAQQFTRERDQFMVTYEDRKRRALMRNLAYVERKERQKLQEGLSRMHSAQKAEQQLRQHHDRLLQQRIAHVHGNQHNSNKSIAIYVSGLPANGPTLEALMQSMFGAFGTIRRIHFYRDRATGRLKGDALVLYEASKDDDDRLIATVCSQMDGAELPGGIVLSVQAANSGPQKKDNGATRSRSKSGHDDTIPVLGKDPKPSPQDTRTLVEDADEADADADESEDLDDFFASLE